MLGFVLGISDIVKFIKSKCGNSVIREAIIGTLISVILVIIPGWPAISYLFAGRIYGIIIDLVATRFSKSE